MVDIPEGEDTEMNMTPMIDIVFQLIIFFVVTLKFKTVDRRIDSALPKDRGLAPTAAKPTEFEKIKIKLFRKNKGDPTNAFTRIRIGNNKKDTVDMPKGKWPGDAKGEYKMLDGLAPYFGKVEKIIARKWAEQGNNEEVVGEIAAMPPDGGAVPHGDIMRILDMLIKMKIGKVVFEGAAPPLMASEGGSMTGTALGGG